MENKNENCESCKKGEFLLKIDGFGNNCVKKCPKDTGVKNNTYCLDIKEIEGDKSFILWIFAGTTCFILLVLFICIYSRLCRKDTFDIESYNYLS